MSTFHLTQFDPAVPVTLPSTLSPDQLQSFPAFKTWLNTLSHSLTTQSSPEHVFHSRPYRLRGIDVQSVDFFGGNRVGFVKLKADVSNEEGEKLPGSVFLRGGSVGMLLILQANDVPVDSEDGKYVILTVQPRIPAGSLAFVELPAGMLDDAGSFAGRAAQEIAEETGLEIAAEDLLNLTELAISSECERMGSTSDHKVDRKKEDERDEEQSHSEVLQRATYSSPGGSDEFIPLYLWQKRVDRDTLGAWQGKLTGLREHGEKITLMLCPLSRLWSVGARDSKALCALALYEALKQKGQL